MSDILNRFARNINRFIDTITKIWKAHIADIRKYTYLYWNIQKYF